MNASHSTTRTRRTTFSVLAILAVGALGACSGSGTTDAVDVTTSTTLFEATTTTSSDTTAPTDTTAAPTGNQQGGSSQGSTGNGGGNGSGGSGGSTPPTSTSSAPRIDSFGVPATIDCSSGGDQPFTISWSTSNTTKVTISIDGPGIWDTFPPNGEATLPYSGCSSPHTYLITAFGADGSTVTKQVSIEPRES